jgi:putative ABC transport system permease protein
VQFSQSIEIALQAIRANKLRSTLTLLGIIIGVMTIIAMQSLITGMRNSVINQAAVLGSNVFQIQKFPNIRQGDFSKYRNRKNLTVDEGDAIREKITAAENVGAEVWMFGREIRGNDKKTLPMMPVAGATPEFLENNSYEIADGRFVTNQDNQFIRKVAVIGSELVNQLFPYKNPIGQDIKVEGERFEVVGVFAEMGSFLGGNRDDRVVIPITRFEKLYGKRRSIHITIKAKGPEYYQEAIDQATAILRVERKVPFGEESDFEIRTNEQFMEFFDNLTKYVRFAAIAIASISLLVAGVGIMNIMLVSVTERTREIGIQKSLGAKRKDILWQFLIEAVVLSQLGGLIGILLGIGIGKLVAAISPVPAAVPVWTVFLGFAFCSFVGMVFGVYPATKAARLDPITALRFE